MFIFGLILLCFITAILVVGLLGRNSDGKGGPQDGDC